MNKISSYCGLTDARVRAFEKDSPWFQFLNDNWPKHGFSCLTVNFKLKIEVFQNCSVFQSVSFSCERISERIERNYLSQNSNKRQEEQRRQIQDALNRQSYEEFRAYAEQQYPDNPDQQAILIRQLQEQHYYQYMQQVRFFNQYVIA